MPTGPASAIITSGLPAGCTNPGAQSTTVTNGGTATVNFTVTCPVPTGSVTGTITFTGATPSPTGISVVVTPTGLGALAAVNPNAGGVYTRTAVPVGVGSGSVALSTLPSGCTAPAAGSYSGLTNGGSVTVNFTVACTPPPVGYPFTGTAVDNGATVTITFSLDMNGANDPAIPGIDDISAIQGSFTYNSARLSAPVCGNVAGSGLTNGTFNTSTPGFLGWLNFSTTGVKTGVQGVLTCTFTDAGAGALTTVTTLTVAASDNGTDLLDASGPAILINDVP